MRNWPHGKALSDDKRSIRYLSPSALMAADPGTNEGCPRRYWFEYKKGLKQDSTQAQILGTEIHAQNEHYLLTGEKNFGPIAMAGFFMLPKPFTLDPRIMIEHEIAGNLETAPLRAAGIPVAGYIDCIHWQGTNTGGSDVTDTQDPENTVEIIDWKSTSSEKWIKSAQEVSRTLQMTIYGQWAVVTKGAEWVRLSHGYYITKGRHTPRKVSLRVHKDQIAKRWEYVEKLAGSLIEVVKEENPDLVPANTKACGAFRGCPHRSYCSAANHNSLANIFGATMATSLLGVASPNTSSIFPDNHESTPTSMSLLTKLNVSKPPAPALDVQSEMKRLATEEITIRYPNLASQIASLEAIGMGMPKFTGEAARAYAIIKDTTVEAAALGVGVLGGFEFSTIEEIVDVLNEASSIAAARPAVEPAPVIVAIDPFPQDAPVALASPPVVAEPAEPARPIVTAEGALTAAAGEVKGKKAKKTKEVVDKVEQPKEQEPSAMQNSQAINFYVDCIPSSSYQSFWPVVEGLTKAMTDKYGGEDYRCAPKDSPLGFGGWRGFLASALRGLASQIPGGNFTMDTSTETGLVVAEAMRSVVVASGGVYVKGVR